MTIPTLHIPQKDSPQSALAAGINDTETVLTLDDSSIFEADAITRLTLGIDQSATEVITISSYDGDNEITVVRGTPAYSWPLGTLVARVLNADDITEIHQYLEDLHTTLSGGSTVTNGNSHDHSGGDGAAIPEGGIGTGAVTADKIGTGAVTADKIGTGAVTTAKIGADAIDGTKIADDAINSEHIYPGAIDTEHIGDSQITSLKLAASSVIEAKIANRAITEPKLLFPYIFGIPTGRLTLESGVPISSADQTEKSTLYYTPYTGNTILLYISGAWKFKSFAELSLSLSGYAANKNYDIWIYDNSGTVTLDSTVWTSDTARATALAYQDGILIKSGDATRRYLGTIRMTGTIVQTGFTCEDSNAKRFVWNMYNRTLKKGLISGALASGSGVSYNKGSTYFVIGHPNGLQVLAGLSGNITGTGTSYAALYLLYDGGTNFADALTGIGWGTTQADQINIGASVPALFATGYHYISLGWNVQDTTPSFNNGRLWFMMEM